MMRIERIFADYVTFAKMKKDRYKHIFIDLDKTIWDFESNSRVTFREIFEKHQLRSHGISHLHKFTEVYTRINDMLWGLYRENKIKKEVLNIRRFELTLQEFGLDNLILATHIAEDYVALSPLKTILFPYSREALNYLKTGYSLHIITNGFEEVQQKKLDVCDLRKYFATITTSEEAGVKKPETGIFELALEKAGAKANESLMIGDDLQVDMAGARLIGMDTLFFNPQRHLHQDDLDHEVHSWHEVMKIL
jgi:putative hydrolase of the HAD superfamily